MTITETLPNLPDPNLQSKYYANVVTKRFFAFLIDTAIILLITVALIPLSAFTALIFHGTLALVVSLVYRTVSLTNRSATPGMRMMSIEFRNHKGERFGFGISFVHTVFLTISMSMVFPQLISIILMLTSARGQGLYDQFLGSVVINRAT